MTVRDKKTGLTEREEAFVREYLVDFNGVAAVRRAGLKASTSNAARTAAYKLLHRPSVQAELARRRNAAAQATGITQERVMQELGRIALSDMRRLYGTNGELKPIHELDDDEAAAIAGIEFEEIRVGQAKLGTLTKVKRWDKTKALEMLCRVFSMFNDSVTLKGDFADRLVRARERSRQARS